MLLFLWISFYKSRISWYNLRMSISNAKKYKDVILYLCDNLGGKIEGKKKLAKLLYFADFDMFEYKESMMTITGDNYKALQMGPVPANFMKIVESLEQEGLLKQESEIMPEGYKPKEIFRLKENVELQYNFSDDEKFILDRVIKKYGELNGKQLEDLTHGEAPWNGVGIGEDIPFELSFYRETSF